MRDYFPYDADVYYYDLLWVSEARSWVDEAVLIDQIFQSLLESPTPVAYLALMTITNNIKADKDYQAPHMKLSYGYKIHFGMPDECTIWLYQILHMKVDHLSTSVTMALHKRYLILTRRLRAANEVKELKLKNGCRQVLLCECDVDGLRSLRSACLITRSA